MVGWQEEFVAGGSSIAVAADGTTTTTDYDYDYVTSKSQQEGPLRCEAPWLTPGRREGCAGYG
ncbi:MAG: hypothetical protein EXR72_25130 [Myxococcales bacterium]|nr:hypothetical protein [Myxococcales bacterium]